MGQTGVSLTGPARREKASEAYRLAIKRVTYTEIGKALDMSRQLVSNLVQEEQDRIWSGRDLSELNEEKRRSIETYETVIHTAWQRLGRIHDASLNVSGLFNVIISAQKAIDEITGAKAPTRSESDVNISYRDYTTGTELTDLFAEIDGYLETQDAQGSEVDSEEPLYSSHPDL